MIEVCIERPVMPSLKLVFRAEDEDFEKRAAEDENLTWSGVSGRYIPKFRSYLIHVAGPFCWYGSEQISSHWMDKYLTKFLTINSKQIHV